MDYMTEIYDWANTPNNLESLVTSILRLDQLMEKNLEMPKRSRQFLNRYIINSIYTIYVKSLSEFSIASQSDMLEVSNQTVIDYYYNLGHKYVDYKEDFYEHLIVFSSRSNNRYLKLMQKFSKDKEVVRLTNWFDYDAVHLNKRHNYFLHIAPDDVWKYKYDPLTNDYIHNLTTQLINHTQRIKNNKFLIAFEFISTLNIEEKVKFFRSFIRNILISYLSNPTIELENIHIYFESKKEVDLFNNALSNIIQLIKFHHTKNALPHWYTFLDTHPYSEFLYSDTKSLTIKSKPRSFNDLEIIDFPDTLQGRVKTISPVFKKFLSHINIAAESEINILLLGETGVGKGELAKQIHQTSIRKDKPFVALNCAAIPESLIDSELFGSIKGAYTDSKKDKMGKIEAADGGILFLDEIGNAPLTVQQKILTFIQSKKFHPVGSESVEKEVDVRIFFATNKKPEELVSSGLMLADFYFRIIEPNYTVPALRERSEDIPEFVNYFIQVYQTKIRWQLKPTVDAMSILCKLNWPGNIRQLENAILKLFLNCKARKVNEFNVEDVNEVISESVSFDQKSIINNYEVSYNKLFENYLMRRDQLKKIEQEHQSNQIYQKHNQYSFLKLIIEPIAANHYKTLSLNKIEASKLFGLDGSNGETSLLDQKAILYHKIKEYFK